MFCDNELIKIYLMVLAIVFFLHYCELKQTTVIEKLVPESKVKDITNHLEKRKRTNYNRYLDLRHVIHKRKPHLKTHDEILKQQFDDLIFHQNLQLLQDQTKKSLLKLQNSYLENFYIKNPNNKFQRQPNSNKKSKNKLRIRRDDEAAFVTEENYENTECADNDDDEEVITTSTETSKQLLEEIVNDLDEIREGSITTDKGKTCQLNGTWISDIVGIGFNISLCKSFTLNNTNLTQPTTTKPTTTENPKNKNCNQTESIFIGGDVNITFFGVPLSEDSDHMKVLNCSWDIKARIPFSHTTMLIITAEYTPENRIAVFVGQCRYCDKTEMVVGQWMIQKLVHDCRKLQTAQDVFGDVLRRQPRTVC